MKVSPVCSVEIGNARITSLVGDLNEGGSICILGKGEYTLAGAEFEKASYAFSLKKALGNAEENAEVSIVTIHLVMPSENITSLNPKGAIPVLTSLKDPEIQKSTALIESIDCNVTEVVFSGYCSALAVTTPEQRNRGVVVLDVGSEMVTVAAFVDGKIELVDALRMKRKAEYCSTIRDIYKAVESAGIMNSIPDGILLTGEGARTQGLPDLGEATFGMKCSIGIPVGFKGLDTVLDKPDYAACLGMIRYAYTDGLNKMIRPSPLIAAIKKIFRR